MAAIAKSGTPSPIQLAIPTTNKYADLVAAEDLGAGDACFIDDANGQVYKSNETIGGGGGVAENSSASEAEGSRVDGYAATAVKTGNPVTLLFDVVFAYAAPTQKAGVPVYLSGSVDGGLNDAAANSQSPQIGLTLTKGRIHLKQSW